MRILFLSRRRALYGLTLVLFMLSVPFLYSLCKKPAEPAVNGREPIYQGNTGQKALALAVNVDWGEEYIPAMLAEFKKVGARVTFFVTGRWAEKNPDVLKSIANEGHSVQNHGYKHIHFASLSPLQTAEEIKKAEEVIFAITGQRTSYFASPYGEQNRAILQGVHSLDYELVMWSVDTIDWQKPSPETIIKRVMNKVHNDAIVLMHPTDPTVKALPQLLQNLQGEGYTMLPIEQVFIKAKGSDAH